MPYSMSRKVTLHEQHKDTYCNMIKRSIKAGEINELFLDDDRLLYKRGNLRHQLIVSNILVSTSAPRYTFFWSSRNQTYIVFNSRERLLAEFK